MVNRRSRPWDRHAILAEIRRRGFSLRRISIEAGLSPSACCKAFTQPFPAAETAIACFLDVSVHELWPDRYPTLPISVSKDTAKLAREASLNAATVQTPPQSIRAVNP